jgi:accessory gene regulator B
LLEKLALKFAVFLYDAAEGDTKYSVEAIEYGNKILFNSLCVMLFTLIPATAFGYYNEASIVLFCFANLRFFSGGFHVQSLLGCAFTSSSLMLSIILLDELLTLDNFIAPLYIITVIILLVFAPYNIEIHKKLKLIKTDRQREILLLIFKVVSMIIVTINFIWIHSSLLALTYFIQSLTTIHKKRMI